LIAEFNARRSEEAFAALVRQHVNLVFATALRQVGDAGAAEEITQNVFVALAQAAGKLGSHPTIAGWLHQTALNKSREWLRSELRRRKREQVAVNLDLARAEGDSVWSALVPLLDEALLELREPDRQAVLLHFMEGQTFQEVGSALGVGEDAARKRVNRCLDQLTDFFRRKGFAVPALGVGAPLFALTLHTAPAGLTAAATTASLASAHSAASTLTLIKGALKIMAWTKAKTAAVVVVAVILAGGSSMVAVSQIKEQHESKVVNAFIEKPDATFSEENDPQFRKVREMGADAVPYLVGAIKKYNSVRDTPLNPASGHAEGRDLIRIRAYWGLRGLGASAKPALPFLIQQFSTNNDLIDFDFDVLARLGPEARETIPVLMRAFHGTDSQMRFYAARALAKIDPDNPELLPTMLADLKSSDVVSRRFAAHILGELGPKASPAIPALTEAFGDEDNWVRINATNALKKIKLQMPAEDGH